MTAVKLAPEVIEDLERIVAHLEAHEGSDLDDRADEIISALDVLAQHPMIGRLTTSGLRELVIGKRTRGYVALYRYQEGDDLILVLAIRSQREAGYTRAD
ncbi:type II toxin-antitoxin system RelE/ParE family toxin [Ideonella azotifigens]|uniref:Type II toxin-antitoxin system RelE/ParE family toxin n=1 Tax=Ideonella azotifigens TaxID=513160 RepID=A0ABN1KCE0_9BURK|nr:type II toxin-antitoxin system RelE/ParE family toxin [Ideonella azotifigens]MCD2343072.1 type II toxin-antitoxin system RelE/ParE family toxin [Ideonella azotifigens]